ncbi:hypothetical protein HDU98_001015, partial [Podochytrium sp. JEL0797]
MESDSDSEDIDEDGQPFEESSPLGVMHSVRLSTVELIRLSRRAREQHTTDRDRLVQVKEQLCLMSTFVTTHSASVGDTLVEVAVRLLAEEIDCLAACISNVDEEIRQTYSGRIWVEHIQSGRKGRPKFDIDFDTVLDLRGKGTSWSLIANLAVVHRNMLSRHLKEREFVDPFNWTNISDDQLLEQVQEVHSRFPQSGVGFVSGHLLTEHRTRVSRKRVRHALNLVDPVGRLNWVSKTIARHRYTVAGPHSLQHIDGNHKLVRYKFVIHAGIDGFSHLLVFCKLADNNRPETMLQAFLEGVAKHGIPSRVRCDKGGENIKVAEFMIQHKGAGRASVIAGRSVHNQRIERFNLDLRVQVLQTFIDLFADFEATNLLNVSNNWELWVLHQVYFARIQKRLDENTTAHNSMKKRMHSFQTPEQVFAVGHLMRTGFTSPDAFDSSLIETEGLETYGSDPSSR